MEKLNVFLTSRKEKVERLRKETWKGNIKIHYQVYNNVSTGNSNSPGPTISCQDYLPKSYSVVKILHFLCFHQLFDFVTTFGNISLSPVYTSLCVSQVSSTDLYLVNRYVIGFDVTCCLITHRSNDHSRVIIQVVWRDMTEYQSYLSPSHISTKSLRYCPGTFLFGRSHCLCFQLYECAVSCFYLLGLPFGKTKKTSGNKVA